MSETNRREFLKCAAWSGTGLLWTLNGGISMSGLISNANAAEHGQFSFVQISDTHIGFNKPANPDPIATLRVAIAQIKRLPVQPTFILHTGDITHLSKESEFDDAEQVLKEIGLPIHFVPGEHDVQDETNGKVYLKRFGKNTFGDGWYSFDAGGAHFVGLVNVVNLQPGGFGSLGSEQIEWLKKDLAKLSASKPIVVFTHMPMWSLYPEWGWGTADSAEALKLLNRFGSVTVLNGHIHQIQQKIEGHMVFHTARSTAFPQPAPGDAKSPGPLTVPAEQLRTMLGLTSVRLAHSRGPLALTDSVLTEK
ncbi:MAG TPA: metallophosphoesterase [Steroidobacteraceae bacterium]|nr:metallophosphoesterase [Steroidobacteraceae bacterium]